MEYKGDTLGGTISVEDRREYFDPLKYEEIEAMSPQEILFAIEIVSATIPGIYDEIQRLKQCDEIDEIDAITLENLEAEAAVLTTFLAQLKFTRLRRVEADIYDPRKKLADLTHSK